MKQLKFKAWDNYRQKMHKLQGMTFDAKTSVPTALKLPGVPWRPVEEYELLQWVYLSDKNGVDVYEGDYIKISSTVYKVVWNDTISNFQLEELEGTLSRSIIDISLGNIVGNKFENADL
ncbi:YopX family protein [Clostridium estertheticum]|uniref:YopX family protein n=1 Tax=Clostridium estertheticum TaxID=238834 RepID=UPI0013E9873F|nr:YopX family protein [Clostridium estertheticum]MBZ9687044.1 YopX family protein [Clostridium estertheticum]